MAPTITACVLLAVIATSTALHPLSDEFISLINSKQNSWKAGRNFSPNTPLAYIKKLMGLLEGPLFHTLPVTRHDPDLIENLPENFDPREKWPGCPSLDEIRDQGACGSCWAFGAVEAMTDRVCIYSNGAKHFHFSADDLLSCCSSCGASCHGGAIFESWQYWQNEGIVSGGSYNSGEGCRPYEIPPCEHHTEGNRPKCEGQRDAPECAQKCQNNIEYVKDKHHGTSVYFVQADEDNIKAELYSKGPVEAGFEVFEDFLHYKSGVYSHTSGARTGAHAIKILGWGVENGKKYWLCANSWNTDWGDKGFFKIQRGNNECGIEGLVVAGDPDLSGI